MAQLALGLAGLGAAFFAGLMVLQRSLYVAAVCLLAVLLQVAVLFFLSGAPLLAFLQVMIYAGAVMVLIVVAIMAAGSSAGERWSRLALPWPVAAAGFLLPFLEIALIVARGGPPSGGLGRTLAVESQVGQVLFESHAVATEAVGLLLFLAGLSLVSGKKRSAG